MGGWWRWALVSPDGVAPSQMVGVSASDDLPLQTKSRSSLLAPAHPSGPGKRAIKRLWWCGGYNSENSGRCISSVSALWPMHATILFKNLHTDRFAIAQMAFKVTQGDW